MRLVKKIKVSEKSQSFPSIFDLSQFGWHCRIRVWRALYRFPSWLPLCDFNRFKFSRHPTETRTQSQPLDLPTVDNGRVFAVHEDIALPNERYKYRLIHLHTTKFKFKLTEIYFLSYCGFSNTNLDSFCIYLVLDVEDQAMKISIQEHMHFATIQTMENDLNSGQVSTSSSFVICFILTFFLLQLVYYFRTYSFFFFD